MARKRHLSRVAVMQTLFEKETHPQDTVTTLLRDISFLEAEFGQVDTEFANILLQTVESNMESIKASITKHAPEWSLDRMDPIARSILFSGAAEILFLKDAPTAVVINEAIDIAKDFGGSETSKFVNGVLHALAKATE